MNIEFNIEEIYLKCISKENYANPDGGASRTEFISFFCTVYGLGLGFVFLSNNFNFPEWTNFIYGIWFLFNVIPLGSVVLRRMVDAGISRWWFLLIITVFLFLLLLLILAFKPSKRMSISERNQAIDYLKQGNNEYRNGNFNEAIEYYDKAIEIDKNFKEAYNNIEKAAKKAKDTAKINHKTKDNSGKSSFWQRFNNSKEVDNFIKGRKYFWYFVGIFFIINSITRPLAFPGGDGTMEMIFYSLFGGFTSSFGYSILLLIGGNIKINEFKATVIEGGVGCSTILLLMFTVVAIAILISVKLHT